MTSDVEAGCYIDLHLSRIGVGVESLNRLLYMFIAEQNVYIYREITNSERELRPEYSGFASV
jgi:hypothetical protein